jgi:hypothetical protein
LSNAQSQNFVGQSVILHGASQHYAADHRRCLKYHFFPVSTLSGENVLKSLLEGGFEDKGSIEPVPGPARPRCNPGLDYPGASGSGSGQNTIP